MKITRKDVERVAALAHLEFDPVELERMAQQLDAILEYIDQLNRLDTTKVEPMAQVLADTRPNPSVREDAVQPCLPREQALAAAPEADGTFFKVPKVIEK
ncbi:MAG: Asp-tRNA(Asn)/Glu-tRNA(Gln) amidotransferase subunit GatC [Acidobacteria bacterium]|nr:Asp-tRNA(Asn)/Glu-tRNA(Gln) amidotransferase subunit GatC [Acidobacteriota bacterium]